MSKEDLDSPRNATFEFGVTIGETEDLSVEKTSGSVLDDGIAAPSEFADGLVLEGDLEGGNDAGELVPMTFEDSVENFCENLAIMLCGGAGSRPVEYGKHGLRGVLSSIPGNVVSNERKIEIAHNLVILAETSSYAAYQVVQCISLVADNVDLVDSTLEVLVSLEYSRAYAPRAMLRQKQVLAEPEFPEKDVVMRFTMDAFVDRLCVMIYGRCGEEMEEIGRQCVRGLLFGGVENPISRWVQGQIVECLLEGVSDEEMGRKVMSMLFLVEGNDEIIVKALEELSSRAELGLYQEVMEVLGRDVEILLGVSKVEPDTIVRLLDGEVVEEEKKPLKDDVNFGEEEQGEKPPKDVYLKEEEEEEEEGILGRCRKAIRLAGDRLEYAPALERCLLRRELWRDVLEAWGRSEILSRETMLQLVERTDHWREVVRWYAPAVSARWGEGRREEVLRVLREEEEMEKAEKEEMERVVVEGSLAIGRVGGIGHWRIGEAVLNAGQEASWEPVSPMVMGLVRGCTRDAENLAFRKLMRELVLSRKDQGSRVLGSTMRAIYWGGLRGQVLTPTYSALTRVFRNGKLVGRIVDFAIGSKEQKRRRLMMKRASSLARQWVALDDGNRLPPMEWWAAYCNDVPGLDDALEPKREKGAKLGLQELLYAAAIGRADAVVRHLIEEYGVRIKSREWAGSKYYRSELKEPVVCVAARRGAEGVLRILLEAGGDPNDSGRSSSPSLCQALSMGHVECARLLLENGAEPEGGKKTMSLIVAARRCPVAIPMLLKAGASPNTTTLYGQTPLMFAAEAGLLDAVQILIDHGADVSIRTTRTGQTALMFASGNPKNALVVKALLAAGAEIDAFNNDGMTALAIAALVGAEEPLQVLIEAGANLNIRTSEPAAPESAPTSETPSKSTPSKSTPSNPTPSKTPSPPTGLKRKQLHEDPEQSPPAPDSSDPSPLPKAEGRTPLMWAVEGNSVECVKLLAAAGAEVDAAAADGMTALALAMLEGRTEVVRVLIECGANLDVRTAKGDTPLMWAVRLMSAECVDAMVRAGVDINASNVRGETALILAAALSPECLKILLEAGADVHAKNRNNSTALWVAALNGRRESLSLLVAAGSSLEPDKRGTTPLMVAARGGHKTCVQILVEVGVDVNLVNDAGTGALHITCSFHNTACTEFLIESGADVNRANQLGETPLMAAANAGDDAAVRALLQAGADVNASTPQDYNALMFAAEHGRTACIQALLHAGADPNSVDCDNITPILLASATGDPECVKLLLQAGADPNPIPRTDQATVQPPLHAAVQVDSSECVQLLLEHGANVDAVDSDSMTAYKIAQEMRCACAKTFWPFLEQEPA